MPDTITVRSSVRALKGVGDHLATRLGKLGVVTVGDLIELLPRRVEDRTQLRLIKELTVNEPLVITGQIEKISSRVSQRGVFIVSAKITDKSGSINALWFNQRYLLRLLRVGDFVTLFGEQRPMKAMGAPFFVKKIIERPENAPIYPLTTGVSQATIQKLMRECQPVIAKLKDRLPLSLLSPEKLSNRAETLWAAHFEPGDTTLARAIKLLGYEELITICLAAVGTKRERQKQRTHIAPIAPAVIAGIQRQHVFKLTDAQRTAIQEIAEDLGRKYPMNRLLYGEVGSGKTAVGLVATIAVAAKGQTVLWLSPTTTLATQQDSITKDFCEKFQLRSALLTGSVKESAEGADVIVGTHALLHNRQPLKNVGLVVIDEQQRFGVEQRNVLLEQYPGAHLLMLSATPIPRTLAHTIFGHIDVSYLHEKPQHQQPITTKVFTETSRLGVEEHIQKRLAAGQPGYVVCPLIDGDQESQKTLFDQERKAVTTEHARLRKVFQTAKIGLLHGRLKPEQKAAVMNEFRSGRLDILVATSVIEVGIDNQNATWILIEEADHFGLSQLHQLRGRVGRGSNPSVCFLHNSQSSEHSSTRLNALVKARDGLEIAELDLHFRGPGNIAGRDQSGLPGIRYADLGDTPLIRRAYQRAKKVGSAELAAYPDLAQAVKELMRHGLTAT